MMTEDKLNDLRTSIEDDAFAGPREIDEVKRNARRMHRRRQVAYTVGFFVLLVGFASAIPLLRPSSADVVSTALEPANSDTWFGDRINGSSWKTVNIIPGGLPDAGLHTEEGFRIYFSTFEGDHEFAISSGCGNQGFAAHWVGQMFAVIPMANPPADTWSEGLLPQGCNSLNLVAVGDEITVEQLDNGQLRLQRSTNPDNSSWVEMTVEPVDDIPPVLDDPFVETLS